MNDEKLIPKLRFNGFDNEWESFKLTEISERITRKNKSLETDRPLTISAQYGLVDQIEFFNKIVASKSLKGYYLLKNGEFAYNKSYSNGYPFGAVKRLDKYENGAISTLYICFKVNDKMNSDLMKEYFETDKWYKEIYKIAVKGARNHGLLNIAVGDFFNTKHILPTNRDEQEKIANFLIEINKKIDLLENKLLNYQNFKKYLMHQIFAQKLRFADYIDEWKTIKLKDIGEINTGNTPSTAVDEYYSPKKYLWVTPSDISKKYIFDTAKGLSDEGAKKGRFVKKNSVLVTCIASIGKNCIILEDGYFNQQINSITPSQSFDLEFIYYLIDYNSQKMKNYAGITATPILNKKSFENMKFEFPSFNEQKQIGNILSKVDDKIFSIEEMINKTQKYKKGLLQQMFI